MIFPGSEWGKSSLTINLIYLESMTINIPDLYQHYKPFMDSTVNQFFFRVAPNTDISTTQLGWAGQRSER